MVLTLGDFCVGDMYRASCLILSVFVTAGYRQDQWEVLDHLANNKINNTIVLTGDIHSHWVRLYHPYRSGPPGE